MMNKKSVRLVFSVLSIITITSFIFTPSGDARASQVDWLHVPIDDIVYCCAGNPAPLDWGEYCAVLIAQGLADNEEDCYNLYLREVRINRKGTILQIPLENLFQIHGAGAEGDGEGH